MNETAPTAKHNRSTGALGIAVLCAALFAVLAMVVTLHHGLPLPVDQSMHVWSVHHRPAIAVALARGITATGTGAFPYACAATAGLIAGRDTRRRIYMAAGAIGFLALGQAVRSGLLHLIGRSRPAAADWATHASGFAFPSGHATTSALMAGLLAWAIAHRARPALARTSCVLLVGWAVAVGLSRIYLGVHWPSDVLGGWLFALAWLSLGAALIPLVGRPHTVPPGRRVRTGVGRGRARRPDHRAHP
ncbi:phosphatase PAP2 family protein [Streptomyces sp. NPDC060064]|uniref:phosphatase PAP2 family protein n=1 Tax=Streptomyces sp. NPDC060064 TaxID=3347049 RepID=UPI0036906FB8